MTATHDADAGPASAARQAAEAAFAMPPASVRTLAPAAVIVRRKRLAHLDLPPPPAEGAGGIAEPKAKGARVFRVDAVPPPPPPAAAAAVTSAPAEAPMGDDAAVVPARAVSRRRSVANDRRPGPVVHVVHALPPRPVSKTVEPLVPLKPLSAALASVDPKLELIRRAQGFQVLDPRVPALWQQLANTAARIRADIDSLLDAAMTSRSRKAGFLP